jgi:hypothetical protein
LICCRWRVIVLSGRWGGGGSKEHVACCMLHVARHASHVTRHTSHVTRHTSHVTLHTLQELPDSDISEDDLSGCEAPDADEVCACE